MIFDLLPQNEWKYHYNLYLVTVVWQWLTEASDLPLFVHSCYANDDDDGNELMLIITSVQMEMCQCGGGGGGGKEQMITLNEWNDRSGCTGSSLLIAPLNDTTTTRTLCKSRCNLKYCQFFFSK